MAWIGQRKGVVTLAREVPQETRTTVHHIVKRGVAKKGPDWWTIPVSKRRHVHGERSIDKLGKEGFREEWGLPPYEKMALTYLYRYLRTEAYKRPAQQKDPTPKDLRSAATYFQLLQRLIKNGKSAKSWNWIPPERSGSSSGERGRRDRR